MQFAERNEFLKCFTLKADINANESNKRVGRFNNDVMLTSPDA